MVLLKSMYMTVTMYLWYYDDLKSDKRGNNLSYSVDVPE